MLSAQVSEVCIIAQVFYGTTRRIASNLKNIKLQVFGAYFHTPLPLFLFSRGMAFFMAGCLEIRDEQ
jgi:hypothetical protein